LLEGFDDRDALSLYFARGVGMAFGATHITINAMGSKLGPIEAHLQVLAMVAEGRSPRREAAGPPVPTR
jgi:hypothetical protein